MLPGHEEGSPIRIERMPTYPPPDGSPYARGTVLHGFRAAVVDVWGEDALALVSGHLPLATRVATIDTLVLPFEWLAIDHVMAWHDAIWNGPVRADERELARVVGRAIDLGFGRFKSAFFAGITPERLVERAQELWRWQHTHGEVTVSVEGTSASVLLKGHPYVDHPLSRRVTAESYRHIVQMTGARDVRAAWGAVGSAGGFPSLLVQLSWRA
jgi:hypothetical protein